MKNYFKAFTVEEEVTESGARKTRIGVQVFFPFEDASLEETSVAYLAARDFVSHTARARMSVWHVPRCSHAFNDVRVIGMAPAQHLYIVPPRPVASGLMGRFGT